MLNLSYVPSVFQGRVAGAKGLWMIDTLGEELPGNRRGFWIEVTDEQLKFESHNSDSIDPEPHRVTFEVSGHSKSLTSSYLNYQLLPILLDRGVPSGIFHQLLKEDLQVKIAEIEDAMTDPLSLRKWNQSVNSGLSEKRPNGEIEIQGSMPRSRADVVNLLVDVGFNPMTCWYLKDLVYKEVRNYALRLKERMNIELGQSTSAYMIADPLGILDEDEVHLGFSSGFKDARSRFDQTMLHGMDVLVARLPAHLPSDIQKVRAVFKPELLDYKDVIVFSSRGQVSLASKLSGGDYDGDKSWICWDDRVVQPFRNAPVPVESPAQDFHIVTDDTRVATIMSEQHPIEVFLQHGFTFALQTNMLGSCTTYHEAMCYARNRIDDKDSIAIAWLLGHLVDSAKSGHQFDDAKWKRYLREHKLPARFASPAYKDAKKRPRKDNVIDELVFRVAQAEIDKALTLLHERYGDVPTYDKDLNDLQSTEIESAKTDPALKTALRHAKDSIDTIRDYWQQHVSNRDGEDFVQPIKGDDDWNFGSVVQKCRDDFLSIAPYPDETAPDHESSKLVQRWAQDHSRGKSGHWDLVKASIGYQKFSRGTFIWHIAGRELCEIKAAAGNRGSYRPIVHPIFRAMKIDGKSVDRFKGPEGDSEDLEGDFEDLDWSMFDTDVYDN